MDNFVLIRYISSGLRIALLIFVGIPLLQWLKKKLSLICFQHFSQHSGILLSRILFYSGLLFILITILHECGFNISALLGVAGVFGFAIGFASQTSISNIISGFFLVLEHPFFIGDIIKSNEIMGVVESIDLLSLNIRTSDNKLVRLPNETVLKSNLINLTYYPIRRIDLLLSMPYIIDIEQAQSEISAIIKNNKLILSEPVATVTLQKIGQHDYDAEIRVFLMVRVWVNKENFVQLPPLLMTQLKEIFDKNNCMITIMQSNSH